MGRRERKTEEKKRAGGVKKDSSEKRQQKKKSLQQYRAGHRHIRALNGAASATAAAAAAPWPFAIFRRIRERSSQHPAAVCFCCGAYLISALSLFFPALYSYHCAELSLAELYLELRWVRLNPRVRKFTFVERFFEGNLHWLTWSLEAGKSARRTRMCVPKKWNDGPALALSWIDRCTRKKISRSLTMCQFFLWLTFLIKIQFFRYIFLEVTYIFGIANKNLTKISLLFINHNKNYYYSLFHNKKQYFILSFKQKLSKQTTLLIFK